MRLYLTRVWCLAGMQCLCRVLYVLPSSCADGGVACCGGDLIMQLHFGGGSNLDRGDIMVIMVVAVYYQPVSFNQQKSISTA